ncbi:hypothetical protein MTO96_040498 [Rhipicephalus appendiculatus]
MLVEGPNVAHPGDEFRREGRNVLLMNLELESDKPVVNMTVRDEPTCLSLRKMWARKRENYKGDVENYVRVNTYKGKVGPFEVNPFFKTSRTSLFVISREFCRSRWCMFELSLAQHRLFESDRPHGMVFIKKNDVDKSEMSTLLQYLTKTRTYVKIPPDGSSETLNNLFWLQLQAALDN